MRKLNIIHICDKFGVRGSTIHGVSTVLIYCFPKFDESRFNVKMYALKSPDAASRAVEAAGLHMEYLNKSTLSPGTLGTFVDVIRRNKADLLHLHGWTAANMGRLAGKITGTPTIMHEHGVDPKFPSSQRFADRMLAPCTHTVVAVSQSVKDFLVKERSVPPEKIRVIYNGAPAENFTPASPEKVAQAKEKLGIPGISPVVGTIGRIDTQKGLTYFLQSIPAILKAVPHAFFMIVGDGPRRSELAAEAESLGIGGRVIFTGHRSDIPLLQSMMDVQAFPSLWEGTPITLFEALSMGRTIVSTNVDGLGEILADGKNALVVEPHNAAGLAKGIIRALSDRELARALAFGAKEASSNYDIGHTVRNLESLYEEICLGSGSCKV
jgi:glycosyltransferase involved in cell wall biosynthesis